MTAQVSLVLVQVKDAMLISSSALGRCQPDCRYAVQMVQAGKSPVERLVKIGVKNVVNAHVLEGLQAGDYVVSAHSMPGMNGGSRNASGN